MLARVSDQRAAVKRILDRIASGDPSRRADALKGFMVLAGLRQLEEVIEQEANQMPLLDDILDNKVLGREFRRGLDLGRHNGELAVLLPLMEKRFGVVPSAVRERLGRMSAEEIQTAALRLLDARSVEELFS